MKIIFLILAFTASTVILWAQAQTVFHFNFSFEKDYSKGLYATELNKLLYLKLKLVDTEGSVRWMRTFQKPEFVQDRYGYCLLVDTINSTLVLQSEFTLKVKYKFINGVSGTSDFKFNTIDSLKNIALELFFDLAKPLNDFEQDTALYQMPHYEVIKNPKPALIVKYLKQNETVEFFPVWFEYTRLTRRPVYDLKNTGVDTLYRVNNSMFSGFWGHSDLWNSGEWKPYFFGGTCGTSGDRYIKPGEEYEIVEAFSIGDPLKLDEGFYRYSVNYLDKNKNEHTASTYFNVIYSK